MTSTSVSGPKNISLATPFVVSETTESSGTSNGTVEVDVDIKGLSIVAFSPLVKVHITGVLSGTRVLAERLVGSSGSIL